MSGAPDVPPPIPPPPMLHMPNVDAAGIKQEQAARMAKGSSSTNKTGPQGLTAPVQTAQKTLLG